MSKKANRISINQLEAAMRDSIACIPMERCPEVEIKIRRVLPLQEVLQFVEDVVSSCIDKEVGRYIPEVRVFADRASVLTKYANFTLPKNVEKQYDLIYNTSVFEQVMEVIDRAQYDEIERAIDERIKYEIAIMENSMTGQLAGLLAKMDAFISGSEELFGSADSKHMAALVENLSGAGGMDEKKLVKAVFDARKQEDTPMGDDPVVASDGNVITLRKKKD